MDSAGGHSLTTSAKRRVLTSEAVPVVWTRARLMDAPGDALASAPQELPQLVLVPLFSRSSVASSIRIVSSPNFADPLTRP